MGDQDDDESEALSGVVDFVHALPHPTPHSAAAWSSSVYVSQMMEFGIFVLCLGTVFLLVLVPLFRCLVAIRKLPDVNICRFAWIDAQAGKRKRWLAVMVAGVLVALAGTTGTLVGRSDAVDSLDGIQGDLRWLVGEFGAFEELAETARRETLRNANCSRSLNETLQSVVEAAHGAKQPLRTSQQRIRRFLFWPPRLIPLISTILIVGSLVYCCAFSAPRNAAWGLDLAACSSCLCVLPCALVAFALFFIGGILVADFCSLGPASVIQAQNPKNQLTAAYLRGSCDLLGPAVRNATRLVNETCSSEDETVALLDKRIQDSCSSLVRRATHLYYDAVCKTLADSSLIINVCLAAAGFATLALAVCVPPAAIALDETDDAKVAPDDDDDDDDDDLRSSSKNKRRRRRRHRSKRRKSRRTRLEQARKPEATTEEDDDDGDDDDDSEQGLKTTPSLDRLYKAAQQPLPPARRTRRRASEQTTRKSTPTTSLFAGSLVQHWDAHMLHPKSPRRDKRSLRGRAFEAPAPRTRRTSAGGQGDQLTPVEKFFNGQEDDDDVERG